jgi:hypothetical protein
MIHNRKCLIYKEIAGWAVRRTFVGTREQGVLAIERHCPFILPMSGKSWKCITGGTRISAVK